MSRGARMLVSLVVLAVLLSACEAARGDEDRPVTLEFFQFKPEAIGTFDEVVAQFNAEHPGIRVFQNHVPDADTALRTRLVREDVPDVMTLNAGATFGELASAGVFYDFSDEPVLDDVNPAIIDIINDLGTAAEGEVNGVPFANNALGVIYNRDLFAEHGVDVPETWEELVQAAETFEAAGVIPVYGTLGDAWTSLPAWNAIAANVQPPDFFDQLRADQTSFAEEHDEVARRLQALFSFAQPDLFSRNYDDGNQAFAQGDVAMYLQGSWAIPVIRTFSPEFDIGTFAMPADSPADSVLVSGVDVAITLGREPEHLEEAITFVEYLMREDVILPYAEEQSAVPPLEDTEPPDPAFEELTPYFEEGRIVGFPDHQVPPAIPLDAFNQQFLIDGNESRYLATLDHEWNLVQRRRR